MHNLPLHWHSRVVKQFSNLTFEGYLVDTTSVLSVRSSSISVLYRFCLEYVRTMRFIDDFRQHQLAPSVGNG